MSIVLVDSTSNSLTVSWPETPGAARYALQFRKGGAEHGDGNQSDFETLSDELTSTQARKKNLIDNGGSGFVFRVSAVDHDRSTKTWTTHSKPFHLMSIQDEQQRMDPPAVNLAGKNETLMISWKNYTDALAYELQMRENGPGMDWFTIAASVSGTEARKRNLTSKTGYQFRVRPVFSGRRDDFPFSSPSDSVVALGLSEGLLRLFRSLDKPRLLRRVNDPPSPLADALGGKEIVLLYASAHWCPPCRKYTPVLSQWYQSLGPNRTVEVVFLSADHDENSFLDYFRQMPWTAIPFDDDGREQLMGQLRVSGIPRLVVVDGRSGRVLEDNAVGQELDLNRWRELVKRR
jgi:thiol-disulfide isomerase/thioredoxin